MNRSTLLPTILLLALPTMLTAAAPAEPGMAAAASPQKLNPADCRGLQAFLGAPVSLPLQQLWKGRVGTNLAWSHDGGALWLDAYRSPELPDGPRGSSYGCMGGMIRLPMEGLDVLLYSNLDTDAGRMPERVGASITKEREKITVWASFNGGQTWPVKRLIFDGPSGYSNLAAGRAGTPSAGSIYLVFEGGPDGRRSGIQVAVFNLSWLLNGRELADLGNQRSEPQG